MRSKDGFRQAPGLEQHEAQKNRVPHASPDGVHHIAVRGDTLHQHGVNRHAHHNEHPLETDSEQGLEIVVAHVADLSVHAGGKGNGGKARHQVNLNHTPVDDDENHDV